MWPDLSYILHSLIGTEPDNVFSIVKTFGLFLVLAFIASGTLLYFGFIRYEKAGKLSGSLETIVIHQPIECKEIIFQSIINFILFFKLGYIYFHFTQFKSDPASIIFSAKGHFLLGIIAAIITAIWYFYKMQNQEDKELRKKDVLVYPHQRIYDITLVAALYGILGSKLFSILENFNSFIKDPVSELFSGSGLTIYGGLILAFIMVTRYVKKRGIRPIHMMDIGAPCVMIGYCVGRMGCHFSGDGDWGIVNELSKPGWFVFPDSWWAYSYPHNVLNEGVPIENCKWLYCHELMPKVFPTPLYEVIIAGLLTAFLWIIRNFISRAGVLFFLYCILNGLERFFIEFIRVNPRYSFLNMHLSQAQYIALALIIIGVIGMILYWKKNIRD